MTQKLTLKDFEDQMAVEKEMKQAMRKHGKPGMGKPVRSSDKPKGSPPITTAISFEVPKPIRWLISVIRKFRKAETQ